MTHRLFRGAGFVACWVVLAASVAAQSSAPVVHTHVDRTAMWIGDRVTYSVDIVCPKGIDVLPDDFAKEKLKTTGLDVVGMQSAVTTGADDSTTHHVDYLLTTYRADVPTLEVAPIDVRYFVRRPGQRLEDEAPAGDVRVPGVQIAFRSMLPDDAETAALRDTRPATPRLRRYATAHSAGLALMVVSFAPLAFVGAVAARRWRPRGAGKSVRRVRQEERLTFDALKATDLSTVEGRRRAFDGIDTLVRDHLRDVVGVPGPSLTPSEVTAVVGDRRLRVSPETVAALLASCEHARYGPPEAVPSTEQCREAMAQAGEILGAQ